jgi:hypothetical protein
VCALHVGRAGRLVTVEADHVIGDLVVDGIHVLQRLAPSVDKLGDAESHWLAAGE